MRGSEKMPVEAHDPVAYTGAVLIPFCIGSVALPLALCRASSSSSTSLSTSSAAPNTRGGKEKKQQRRRKENHSQAAAHESGNAEEQHDYNAGISRCTHIRYCYLRDGAMASQDLAYRRACYETASTISTSTSSSEENDMALSASPLYALVERVVFKLPNSFPEPLRELTRPPFFVVDDTWAEHMVEMEVHFRPWLGIAPFTVSHMVLLQTRADFPPQLLSSTFGQTKPPPTVILPSPDALKIAEKARLRQRQQQQQQQRRGRHTSSALQNDENSKLSKGDNEEEEEEEDVVVSGESGICVNLVDLGDIPIVSERRDAIRIFHPTLKVIRYLETLRSVSQPMLEKPPSFCVLPGQKAAPPPIHIEEEEEEEKEENRDNHHRTGEKRRRSINDISHHDNGNNNNNNNSDDDHHHDNNDNNNDNDDVIYVKAREKSTLPPWCFPFEAIMHAHEPKRQIGSVDAMRAVLAALKKEQDELRDGIEQRISSATANAEELRGIIQRMRDTCALLEKQERK